MVCFDAVSLFTNNPLQETIDLNSENLFDKKESFYDTSKDFLLELLTLIMNEPFILFNNEYDRQLHDSYTAVVMGSPLDLV